ncbi:enoyl-CoA hydratase/isomerase family protein [Janibacter melonis]|uniref:enoyl-CoA hydratase/isomerase family protein n=1 Tax=Janibacter melonis TaxID=262209 RepID=UPI002095C407|nr:enoyl-CoA hydratase-related protein [Janibacter melonis]
MSAADAVRVEQHGSVRVLVLNRPERRNALGMQERVALADALAEATAADDVRAVVLTGAGAVFCAGGDVSAMTADLEVARRRMVAMEAVTRAIAECPCPSSPRSKGCLRRRPGSRGCLRRRRRRAGRALLRLLRQGRPHGRCRRDLGAHPPGRLVPRQAAAPHSEHRARRRGPRLGPGRRAGRCGYRSRARPGVAERLAGLPPLSLRATKELLATLPPALDDAMTAESTAQLALFGTEDFAEGQSAFAQRRRPVFLGR